MLLVGYWLKILYPEVYSMYSSITQDLCVTMRSETNHGNLQDQGSNLPKQPRQVT